MEDIKNQNIWECKIINMADYKRKQALIGILNRPELSEQMKKYPSSKPIMKVVYNKEEENELLRYIIEHTKNY